MGADEVRVDSRILVSLLGNSYIATGHRVERRQLDEQPCWRQEESFEWSQRRERRGAESSHELTRHSEWSYGMARGFRKLLGRSAWWRYAWGHRVLPEKRSPWSLGERAGGLSWRGRAEDEVHWENFGRWDIVLCDDIVGGDGALETVAGTATGKVEKKR